MGTCIAAVSDVIFGICLLFSVVHTYIVSVLLDIQRSILSMSSIHPSLRTPENDFSTKSLMLAVRLPSSECSHHHQSRPRSDLEVALERVFRGCSCAPHASQTPEVDILSVTQKFPGLDTLRRACRVSCCTLVRPNVLG